MASCSFHCLLSEIAKKSQNLEAGESRALLGGKAEGAGKAEVGRGDGGQRSRCILCYP